MFAQNLDNTSALTERVLIPLEVPTSVVEHGSELVTLKLIGGEDPGARRVREEDLVHVFSNQAHARLIATLRNCQFLPIRDDDGFPSGVYLFDSDRDASLCPEDNREDFVDGSSPFVEEFSRLYDESHFWRTPRPSLSVLASGIGT
jgi:hypothetical protein